MPFWKREKRRRQAPPRSEPPGSAPPAAPPIVAGFVSAEHTGQTVHGKRVVRIGDPERFRQEDALRDRARAALEPEDESQAQALIDLIDRYAHLDDPDSKPANAIEDEIRAVGRLLCEDGGSDRMKLVAFRVAALNPGHPYANVRTMESFWDGICGWQV